jgi:triacylglycerol esterase/lipase EstA (alpha/beta hydrolase family)
MPATASDSKAPERADLLSALAQQDMTIVDEVELLPVPATDAATRRGTAAADSETATVEVDLATNEESVVLLEQEGFYSWHFPSNIQTAPPASARGRRGLTSSKAARFTLEFQRVPTQAPQRRGFIQDFLIARARAVVLKFVAHVSVEPTMQFLERNVRRGLIVMESSDSQKWRPVENILAVKLPKGRPARLLLFVHGTFSSTFGSFGGLSATPWGRAFLDAARANYDSVIGFDHATLGEDPLTNAQDLMQRLQLATLPHAPRIDAISHSRGGLVLRSFLEYLLPSGKPKPEIVRAIFVGVVNGGTLLAKPENWHTLIDLYTNLAAATCRVVALFPHVTFGAMLMREIVQSVGAFAKYLATEAITRGGIPGLAAMDPDGMFIRSLNETQPGQITAAESQFYAVLSQFSPKLAAQSPKEIPRQLFLALTNGFIDQLMGEGNDLVVNTSSMTMIDPTAGNFIKDRLDFGANAITYHTNYFLQPQTVNALTRWLKLQPPEVAMPARRRNFTLPGGANPPEVPARVDTDVVVLRADDFAEDAAAAVQTAQPSYVVIERLHEGQTLRYAYPAEQIEQFSRAQFRTVPIARALSLHEWQASPTARLDALPDLIPQSNEATGQRVVAMDRDRVIGVIPETVRPLTVDELVAQAVQASAPTTVTEHIVRKRSLPSFSPPPAAAAARPKPNESKVTCHFLAEMDAEVELQKTATIAVTISRELIAAAASMTSVGGSAQADPTRKLIVQLLAKTNFDVVGETRVELDLPAPNQQACLYFDVEASSEGEGEIWVVIRQGQVPLVNLILRPRIVAQKTGSVRRINAPASTTEAPALVEPLHQLSIFERKKGDDISYQFIFDSPALNLNSIYDSRPITGDRNAYVDQLYKEIENRWVGSGEDAAAFNQDLRAFGADLWDQLFPAELQTQLWQHRDQIQSIMVFSEEPFIPWELVHMKEPGQRLGDESLFLAQKGLVRWLHNFGWPPQSLGIRAARARYIIPNYPHPDYRLPETKKEAAFLQKNLGATAVTPQLNEVRAFLHEGGAFDLLHFAGHGVAEHDNIANAQLMLEGRVENGNYAPAYLSATTVEQFAKLDDAVGNRPIVVINACQTGRAGYKLSGMGGFARAFLTGKAGVFVGALWSVGDQPACTFTEQLYRRLLAGDRLADAAISAREAARNSGEATWLAYVIYGHPHAVLRSTR